MQVVFWTSVPLFAVYLAVSPSEGRLGWPGQFLWVAVMASSAFLTAQPYLLAPSREEGGGLTEPRSATVVPRGSSEWWVYAVVLYLAVYLHSAQIGFF
jgi:hypothetical protein